MSTGARLLLAAAACSRRTGALATLPVENVAVYASSGNVVVFSCGNHQVLSVLPVHEAPVTSVALQALPNVHHEDSAEILLLSASADGNVAAWRGAAQPSSPWKRQAKWRAHEGQPCVAVAMCALSGRTALVTAGMEGGVRLWASESDHSTWSSMSDAAVGAPGETLLECVAMRRVNKQDALVAAAGTDSRVWLYRAAIDGEHSLERLTVLTGHRDWVRGLAFSQSGLSKSADEGYGAPFFFASASKDGTARVWSVKQDAIDEDPNEFSLHTARVRVLLSGRHWSFTAVALLDEHTAAVHSVEFSDPPAAPGHAGSLLRLVTSSMDCSVAVWRVRDAERWECEARFGLMGGGSAHALGFFGASFASSEGSYILGHNFAGALHCWKAKPVGDNEVVEGAAKSTEYLACPAPGGHFAAVTDLGWEPRGRYLLTCSADKTARIYTEITEAGQTRFAEWARPQVHGHAIFTAAFCDSDGRRYVSGAEERMLRVFDAPSSFAVSGQELQLGKAKVRPAATSAVVPELGLSNKAKFEAEEEEPGVMEVKTVNMAEVVVSAFGANRAASIVPLEEELKQKRLWPETAKLYGHGNEISCVAADLSNGILASACKAQSSKDASIILWNASTGAECGRLACHDLTVNQLRFSYEGASLLSASRDRSFAIFDKVDEANKFSFSLACRKKSAHTRLIYTCTWLLQAEFVATGSRDKCLKIFKAERSNPMEIFKQKFESPVSALDTVFSGTMPSGIVAAGFENGVIRVFSMSARDGDSVTVTPVFATDHENRCGGRINRLQWRPNGEGTDENVRREGQLAVACEDVSVRVMEIDLPR